MAEIQINELILGDALTILKECKLEEQIDLVYIDPLFHSGRYWQHYNERLGIETKYEDNCKSAEEWINLNLPVLKQIHRLLSPTGTLYIHCDGNIDGYIRYYCERKEGLFGEKNFIGQIYWQTRVNNNRGGTRSFGNVIQTILMYGKTNDYKFHPKRMPKEKTFPYVERETGRRYSLCNLIHMGDGIGPKSLVFPNLTYAIEDASVFKWSQKNLDEKIRKNPYLIDWSSDKPRYKLYEDEYEGIIVPNLWNDIKSVKQTDYECQWPTQKPIQLLERIIDTSSDKNDIVLDCFCGSGTTVVAAQKMGRQFIGIDRELSAICIAAKRLGISKYKIVHYPITSEDIDKIEDAYDVQWVICESINAHCGKKGADGGFDGHTNITDYPLQIKQRAQIGINDIRKYKTAWEKEGYKKGLFFGTSISRDALNEMSYWKNQGFDFHFYSYQQVIEGIPFKERICIPRTVADTIEQSLNYKKREEIKEKESLMQYFKKTKTLNKL